MKCVAVVLILLTLCIPNPGRTPSQVRQPYRHAYYLFEEHPRGCCPIPLLITKEALAEGQEIKDCLPIITYERDSLLEQLQQVTIKSAEVDERARKVRLTLYRVSNPLFDGRDWRAAKP